LGTALEQVCEALHSYSEPLGIVISLSVGERVDGLTDNQTTILALIVNELATNAIKHAFETKESGHIKIAVLREDAASLKIIVDDDGLPFPELDFWRAGGVGLDLVSKLTEAIGATLTLPPNGSKCFEIIVPICS
jgi:two-component sensor histidine kinase